MPSTILRFGATWNPKPLAAAGRGATTSEGELFVATAQQRRRYHHSRSHPLQGVHPPQGLRPASGKKKSRWQLSTALPTTLPRRWIPPHPSAVNPARKKIGNPTVPLQNRKNSPAAAGAPRKAAIG